MKKAFIGMGLVVLLFALVVMISTFNALDARSAVTEEHQLRLDLNSRMNQMQNAIDLYVKAPMYGHELPSPERMNHMFGAIDSRDEPNQYEQAKNISYYRRHEPAQKSTPAMYTGYELRAFDANGRQIGKRVVHITPYPRED